MAAATRRTFSKVKSSAIRPRQPSVPNLIWVMSWSLVVSRQSLVVRFSLFVGRWSILVTRSLQIQSTVLLATSDQRPTTVFSHQLMQLLLIQMLHHLADILRLVERGDEQRVFGLDNHQVTHADQGDKFAEYVNIIVLRVQGKSAGRRHRIPTTTFCLRYVVLMQRGPGAEVVPSEVGGQTEDAGLRFSLGRARLQHRIVNADVFALRV